MRKLKLIVYNSYVCLPTFARQSSFSQSINQLYLACVPVLVLSCVAARWLCWLCKCIWHLWNKELLYFFTFAILTNLHSPYIHTHNFFRIILQCRRASGCRMRTTCWRRRSRRRRRLTGRCSWLLESRRVRVPQRTGCDVFARGRSVCPWTTFARQSSFSQSINQIYSPHTCHKQNLNHDMVWQVVPKEHNLRLKRATRVRSTFTHSKYKRKRREENQSKAKKNTCHMSQII